MFVEAIEKVTKFTRPILSINRIFGNNEIIPACSTSMIVNDEGWILTCKHVAEEIIKADAVNMRYLNYKRELTTISKKGKHYKKQVLELGKKYGLFKGRGILAQQKIQFPNMVDTLISFQVKMHDLYDLALIKIEGFTKLQCVDFPIFAKDSTMLKQGRYLCRLGYPYPEFTNYRYNEDIDDIEWTNVGRSVTPLFPIEGMLTRLVIGPDGRIGELELSTPGLKGQSGGPLFDVNGIICGIQSSTLTLPLGFDQENREIIIHGIPKKVNDYSFIHLGRCIHVDIIKDFMDKNGVKYHVG